MRLQFQCLRVPAFYSRDWDAIRRAFEHCPPYALGQAWLPQTEADFLPATARFGWHDTMLYLYVELQDADIFNAAKAPNQQTWMLGDVVEWFVKPPDGDLYYELHVTPENHWLQLRFPSGGAARTGEWTSFQVEEQFLHSRTHVEAKRHRWRALVSLGQRDVPFQPTESERTLVSVCRYDYTRGQHAPVISSTSPHRFSDFHRQKEWAELIISR